MVILSERTTFDCKSETRPSSSRFCSQIKMTKTRFLTDAKATLGYIRKLF